MERAALRSLEASLDEAHLRTAVHSVGSLATDVGTVEDIRTLARSLGF